MEVAMTSHIGHGQHENNSKGKGTSIGSSADLAAVEKHNNHDYTQEEVKELKSHIVLDDKIYNVQYDRNLQKVDYLNLYDTVRDMYHEYFDAAIEKHNQTKIEKGKKDQCIDDYFEKISETKNQEVAVEGIIQIGKYENWKNRSIEDKLKIMPALEAGLKVVAEEIPGFKLAGASAHLNEWCPHIQYVGICVVDTPKKDLERRIKKAGVFTKDVLSKTLQDRMRAVMEPLIPEEWEWTFEEKKTGRNEDMNKTTYVNQKLNEENKELKAEIEVLKEEKASLEESIKYANDLKNNIGSEITEKAQARADLEKETVALEEKKEILDKEIKPEVINLEERVQHIEKRIEEINAGDFNIDVPEEQNNFITWCMNHIKGVRDAIYGFCKKQYEKYLQQTKENKEKALQGVLEDSKSVMDKISAAKEIVASRDTKETVAPKKDDISR